MHTLITWLRKHLSSQYCNCQAVVVDFSVQALHVAGFSLQLQAVHVAGFSVQLQAIHVAGFSVQLQVVHLADLSLQAVHPDSCGWPLYKLYTQTAVADLCTSCTHTHTHTHTHTPLGHYGLSLKSKNQFEDWRVHSITPWDVCIPSLPGMCAFHHSLGPFCYTQHPSVASNVTVSVSSRLAPSSHSFVSYSLLCL